MTRDEMLTGWLCVLRLQDSNAGEALHVPLPVRAALVGLGWIELRDDPEDPDALRMHITEEGNRISDLYALDWWIEHEWMGAVEA